MLTRRSLIPLAALIVTIQGSGRAQAQPPPLAPTKQQGVVNDLITGAWFEKLDQAKCEKRLARLEARQQRHGEAGNTTAAQRDAELIRRTRFRIRQDEALYHYNAHQEMIGFPNPLWIDRQTCAALGQYHGTPIAP